MKLTDDPLWSRLQSFEFDIAGDTLTFTKRLARENAWPLAFARQVAEEYRRFIYLTQRAGHPVTPSDEVDQAWHLHLVYTRSYWDGLCAQVLERPLHHGPTRGGRAEDAKYHDWYAQTLESYTRLFGHEPPAEIWPEPARRFSRSIRWLRVDTGAHWLIAKSRTRQAAVIAACTAIFGGVLAACSDGSDGFGIGGWLIIGLVGFIGVFSYLANRTPKGRDKDTSDSGFTPGTGEGCGGGCSSSGNHSSHHSSRDHDHQHESSNDSSSHDSSDSGGGGGGGDSGCSSSGCGGGCGGGD